MRVRLIEKQQL